MLPYLRKPNITYTGPIPLTFFGCKDPPINVGSLQLEDILFVLFKNHCFGVYSQTDKNCVDVPKFMIQFMVLHHLYTTNRFNFLIK